MLDRFAYTAMTGAKHAMGQLANTSHNLANAQTPGFRELLSTFRAVPVSGASADSRAFVIDSVAGANSAPGTLTSTTSPLDIALSGTGMLAVQRANGSEAYTRAGKLQTDANNILRTFEGHRVIGTRGEIRVPEGAKDVEISPDGSLFIKGDDQDWVFVDRLKYVDANLQSLSRAGDGLFEPENGLLPQDDSILSTSRTLELSNVNVAESLVKLISENRMFELNIRMIQTAEQNSKSASGLMSLSRT